LVPVPLDRLKARLAHVDRALFDLVVAGGCAVLAIAIARGRIARGRALELPASLRLCLLFWATLAEMLGEQARADRLTAHCYLIVVGAGVAIQSRRVLVILTAAAVPSWAAVAFVVHAPGFHPSQWWSTWLMAVAAAFTAQLITRTERGVGQRARRAAQNSSLQDPLTGLANRRGLEQQVAPVLRWPSDPGSPCGARSSTSTASRP
jgi:GGDEF domain-containing protein